MKSIKDVKTEMESLLELDRFELSKNKSGRRELQNARKKIRLLTSVRTYLETNPTQEFVDSEIDRITKLIEAISGRFIPTPDISLSKEREERNRFLKEYGVPKMKEQLKVLKYIK